MYAWTIKRPRFSVSRLKGRGDLPLLKRVVIRGRHAPGPWVVEPAPFGYAHCEPYLPGFIHKVQTLRALRIGFTTAHHPDGRKKENEGGEEAGYHRQGLSFPLGKIFRIFCRTGALPPARLRYAPAGAVPPLSSILPDRSNPGHREIFSCAAPPRESAASGPSRYAIASPAHHEPAPTPRSARNRRVCLQIAYRQHQKKKPATDSIAGFPVLVWGG